MICKRLALSLLLLFACALPGSVRSQTKANANLHPSDLTTSLLRLYSQSAELVKIRGVEYLGHKTGPTEFTKCDGDKVDIGDQKPRKSDPCPIDGSPHSDIMNITGHVDRIDVASSMLEIRDNEGKKYSFFVPESARLISTGRIHKPGTAEVRHLTNRSLRITIFAVLSGRAEAVEVH